MIYKQIEWAGSLIYFSMKGINYSIRAVDDFSILLVKDLQEG